MDYVRILLAIKHLVEVGQLLLPHILKVVHVVHGISS